MRAGSTAPAVFLLLGILSFVDAESVEPTKVLDLTSGTTPIGSNPRFFVQAGATTFFTARDQAHGEELWKTDGTALGTRRVQDLSPGVTSSMPLGLTGWNGALYFFAFDGLLQHLWRSDGTAAGTVPLTSSHFVQPFLLPDLVEWNGKLYFAWYHPTTGAELYETDGTAAGTRLAQDVSPGPFSSTPRGLSVVAGKLAFVAETPSGTRPFLFDGSSVVQLADADMALPANFGQALRFVDVNGRFVFVATGTGGFELWSSDGTPTGTSMIASIASLQSVIIPRCVSTGALAYCTNSEAVLLATDGTSAGTQQLGSGLGAPLLVRFGGEVYFSSAIGSSGRELVKTSGTSAPSLVADLNPGSGSSDPRTLQVVGTALYFTADHDGDGLYDLWSLSAPGAAPELVAALLLPKSWFQGWNQVWYAGTKAYFPHPSTGEPWEVELTTGAVSPIGELASNVASSSVLVFVPAASGPLILEADSRAPDTLRIWRSDGTSAGTLLGATVTDPLPRGWLPGYLTDSLGSLYFLSSREFWRSDGTSAGTSLLASSPGANEWGTQMAWVDGAVLFAFKGDGAGRELWRSDGTSAGTQRVADLVPGQDGSAPDHFTVIGNRLYFVAATPSSGAEPWLTDGNAAGTRQLIDLAPGPASSAPHSFTEWNGYVYFVANDGTNGVALWRTDGTSAGTSWVQLHPTGGNTSSITGLQPLNGNLLFVASGTGGTGLFKTDGSVGGSELVTWLSSDEVGRALTSFVSNGRYFFTTEVFGRNSDLWSSDGTEAGTHALLPLSPGGDRAQFFVPDLPGGATAFAAMEPSSGFEIYVSDGTPAGTRQVLELEPGGASGGLGGLVRHGDSILFTRFVSGVGTSLWSAPLSLFDVTPPVIEVGIEGTSGSAGWYRSDVQVTWSVDDPESETTQTGCEPVRLATDSDEVEWVCTATSTGGTSTRSVTLRRDATPPVLTCPDDTVAEASGPEGATVELADPTAIDAMSGVEKVDMTARSGDVFPLGETSVQVTATDVAGNAETCTFTVVVRDTTPPTLLCPEDVRVDEDSAQVHFAPKVSDLVDAAPHFRASIPSGSHFPEGISRNRIVATDASGNSATCEFSIAVERGAHRTATGCSCQAGTGASLFSAVLPALAWFMRRRRGRSARHLTPRSFAVRGS